MFLNGGVPSNFLDRIIFMSMIHDFDNEKREREHPVLKNVTEVAPYANRLQLCHRCFCGPATEQMWWKWKANRPSGVWDSVATEMRRIFEEETFHPILACAHFSSRGKLQVHHQATTLNKRLLNNTAVLWIMLCGQAKFSSRGGHQAWFCWAVSSHHPDSHEEFRSWDVKTKQPQGALYNTVADWTTIVNITSVCCLHREKDCNSCRAKATPSTCTETRQRAH